MQVRLAVTVGLVVSVGLFVPVGLVVQGLWEHRQSL